jgi:predicted Abi (CAAX) family protease
MTHDGLVRTSEIAVTVVVLVLAVLLLASLRRMPRGPRWVVVLACLLLYAVVVVPGAAAPCGSWPSPCSSVSTRMAS